VTGNQHFVDADDFERRLKRCPRQRLKGKGVVLLTVWDQRIKGSPFRVSKLSALNMRRSSSVVRLWLPCDRQIAEDRGGEDAVPSRGRCQRL
jgi:hypothetical protein